MISVRRRASLILNGVGNGIAMNTTGIQTAFITALPKMAWRLMV
jgi:hypothetical protein